MIPDVAAQRILTAMTARTDADVELRAAVADALKADALKAGGSIREVMAVTGPSNDTVHGGDANAAGPPRSSRRRARKPGLGTRSIAQRSRTPWSASTSGTVPTDGLGSTARKVPIRPARQRDDPQAPRLCQSARPPELPAECRPQERSKAIGVLRGHVSAVNSKRGSAARDNTR